MKTKRHLLLSISTLLMMIFAQTLHAQDRVYLKEAYTFKADDGKTYEAYAGEGFRLREIGSTLKIELPDGSVVPLKQKLVTASKDYLKVTKDCYIFESGWAASRPEVDDRNRDAIIDTLKAGDEVLYKNAYHSEYKVKTANGRVGYVDAANVAPSLRYMVPYRWKKFYIYDIKDPLKEELRDKTGKNGRAESISTRIADEERTILIGQVGDFVRLRTLDGEEGWARMSAVAPEGYGTHKNWLYSIMFKVSSWFNLHMGWCLLALALYAVGLFLYPVIPIAITYYLVAYFRLLPNWLCKFLIWVLPLPYLALSGLMLLSYPPFDHGSWSIFWYLLAVVYVLVIAWGCFNTFSGMISSERCPNCHRVGQYTVIDSHSTDYKETTTTTKTSASGYKTKSDDVRYFTVTRYLHECDHCGKQWWA